MSLTFVIAAFVILLYSFLSLRTGSNSFQLKNNELVILFSLGFICRYLDFVFLRIDIDFWMLLIFLFLFNFVFRLVLYS